MWEIDSAEALQALASRLSAFVSERDAITLSGDLGAGKTTFAQGLLSALGVTEAATSPTYQIVHAYETPRRTVYHCDLYRLHPGDEEEIGFAEMCQTGAVIVEWPDIVAEVLPDDRLDVRIEGEGGTRLVTLTGFGAWEKKLARFREIEAFLARCGWEGARCLGLRGDASARQFQRLARAGETSLLMDWPTQSDGPPIRDGRPYCAIAHLAREGTPFIAVSHWLRECAGLSAPAVTASDKDAGLYLVEDLGDAVFGDLIAGGEPLEPLYALAVDGLSAVRASGAPRSLPVPGGGLYDVPAFDREAMDVELDLLLQWYFRLEPTPADPVEMARSFVEAWSPHLDWLDKEPKTIALRDYHSPNLLLCRDRDGLKRLGVIDFQDAVWTHPAYDLVSLLQDARLDVPEAVERALYARYCEAAAAADPAFDAAAFARAYAILGVERNTKILGIFARLSMRDGKHGYLAHLPRIRRYLWRNLAHPALGDLKAWYEAHLRKA
ncbi:tRNA (adenosine(37)-N6)-threonylcarbamoyltransferase complex ATPase subunit type 1 TsaE [Rhodomicrobium vannielii ATCC 17100]|uniref:tRNA (adenosine(37)-N6)-threonylcarbamoyltransferase complex ATPase subunit type 1 TsaE n=1 Tax=Rhodomicrobium vannielii TaxID=1069 RepID=UPI001917CEEB|nr:tRNA (adenosine(37)-N6)-threonylcarbamoyltransferase complex ATPase subunit type 1 TsaE [Rhodomicrobium vannielii ATCC 17100]